MDGWIAFGVTLSIFVAYIVILKLQWEIIEAWDILRAIFWPITLLVWLARRPILRPIWTRILGVVLGIVSLIVFLFSPVVKLRSWWLGRWPESKRSRIDLVTPLAVCWTAAAILAWRYGDVVWAIIFTSGGVAGIIVILVTYFRLRPEVKKANSS